MNEANLNQKIDSFVRKVEQDLAKLERTLSYSETNVTQNSFFDLVTPIEDKHPLPSAKEFQQYLDDKEAIIPSSDSYVDTSQPIANNDNSHTQAEEISTESLQEIHHPSNPSLFSSPSIKDERTPIHDKIGKTAEAKKSPNNTTSSSVTDKPQDFHLKIPKKADVILVNGPPRTGKTSLVIQMAIEICPKNSLFLISNLSDNFSNKFNTMINHSRWKDFHPIRSNITFRYINSLNDLMERLQQVLRIKDNSSSVYRLLVIDNLDSIFSSLQNHHPLPYLDTFLDELQLLLDNKKIKIVLIHDTTFSTNNDFLDKLIDFSNLKIITEKTSNDLLYYSINNKDPVEVKLDKAGLVNVFTYTYF